MPTVPKIFLFLRVFLFAASVPLLMRLRIATVAAILEPGGQPRAVDPDLVKRILAYVATAIQRGRPLVRGGCLTNGLTRYYFLRRAGLDVSLHFGMGRVGRKKQFLGHCWLMKDGKPYLEMRDPRSLYVETYRVSRSDGAGAGMSRAVGRGWLGTS